MTIRSRSPRILIIALSISTVLTGCSGEKAGVEPPAPEDEAPAETPAARTPDASSPNGAVAGEPATVKAAPRERENPAERFTGGSLPTGVRFTIIAPGDGPSPKLGQTIKIHWTGWLPDGRQFWDTRKVGVPQEETLHYDDLISGLVDSLVTMRVGERRELHIPASQAWGDDGYAFVVPPASDVKIDVELVSIGS